MKQFVVYMHENKINHKKYIGLTCQKPEERWRNGKGYKIGYFKKAIDKYGWDNFEHIIVYSNLSKEEACKKEKELISKYNTMNTDYGYNLCEGGNVTTGYHHTKESKKLMSIKRKGMYEGKKNPMYGKKGILAPAFGKHLSEETKEKISLANKGKVNRYAKRLCRKVDQFDLDGDFIKSWNSIAEVERILKIKGTHISRVCRGKRKTTGGYIWKYNEERTIDYVKECMDVDITKYF